jgi:hypothetical protein
MRSMSNSFGAGCLSRNDQYGTNCNKKEEAKLARGKYENLDDIFCNNVIAQRKNKNVPIAPRETRETATSAILCVRRETAACPYAFEAGSEKSRIDNNHSINNAIRVWFKFNFCQNCYFLKDIRNTSHCSSESCLDVLDKGDIANR